MELVRSTVGRLLPSSRALVLATAGAVAVFATGVGPRPSGAFWGPFYDLGLYNLVYLTAAAACVRAARRGRDERGAWLAMALASLVAHQDLRPFLTSWLYGTTTPPMPGHPDWKVTPAS